MATERYSFFNSEGTDWRLYDAFDFAKYHADFYDSGVVHRTNDALKVAVKEGMTLRVANGSAFTTSPGARTWTWAHAPAVRDGGQGGVSRL